LMLIQSIRLNKQQIKL